MRLVGLKGDHQMKRIVTWSLIGFVGWLVLVGLFNAALRTLVG